MSQEELWQRYCGFLELSTDKFLAIQNDLLMNQIERVANSVLGKKIMGDTSPTSVDEFRQTVPLTTYDDYEPFLSERQEQALAAVPRLWGHSAGRGGRFKWMPYTQEYLEKVAKVTISSLILATCREKGRVVIKPGIRVLFVLPPAPYASSCLVESLSEQLSFVQLPPHELADKLEIQDRIQKGFQMALRDGVDIIAAIASVLIRMGEEISGEARGMRFSLSMLHPKVLSRLLQAWVRSKRDRRALLPRDLWPTKAVMTSGMDTAIYRKDVMYYWGNEPYEFYASTESLFIAIQSLSGKGMVFLPDLVFLEFIPYDGETEDRQTPTLLLDELEVGKSYEVVLTHFYGMPLLRYRMRDIIRVIAAGDEATGIRLPHIEFQHRVGETINLAGLTDLDERTVWQAIANLGIRYADWSACKEYGDGETYLRIYLELKEQRAAEDIELLIDEQLKAVDTDYKDIDAYLGLQPVRVTLLSPGTFERYTEEKRKEGADLAHLKPTHMNAPEHVIQRLLQLSESGIAR